MIDFLKKLTTKITYIKLEELKLQNTNYERTKNVFYS